MGEWLNFTEIKKGSLKYVEFYLDDKAYDFIFTDDIVKEFKNVKPTGDKIVDLLKKK